MEKERLKIFSERLTKLRQKKELTQQQLGEALQIPRVSITRYETAERAPTIDHLIQLSQFFNVPTDYLLGLSDVKSYDADLQAICRYTGLNEQAVNYLNIKFGSSAKTILRMSEIANDIVLNFLDRLTCDVYNLEIACKDLENQCIKDLNENGINSKYSDATKYYSKEIDLAMYDASSDLDYFLHWYNIRYTRNQKPFNPFKPKTYEEVFEELKQEFLEKKEKDNGKHNPPKE